jgi:predicted PurR-regulated permease PerM
MAVVAKPSRRVRGRTEPDSVAVAPRTIVLLVVVALSALLLLAAAYAVREVLMQLVVAVVLAMAAEPLVQLLERRGLSRGAAVGTSFALLLAVLAALAYLLLRPLVDETTRLVHDSPRLLDDLSHGRGQFGFLESRFEIVEKVQAAVDSGKLSAAAGPAWSAVGGAVHTGASLVFVLFLTLFVQLGGRQWFDAVAGLAPEDARAHLQRAGSGIAKAVGGYVSGNLVISFVAGSVTTLTLLATGVPYPIALGVVVGIFDLIPLVGATIGTVIVVAVALTTQGWAIAAIVLAVMVAYQQLENHVLQQLVYHRTVKLSPLAIALSVAAGAELAGVPGALLGIPFAGALKVVSNEVLAWRRGEPA